MRIVFYGNETQPAHRCVMPRGTIPVGTVAYCEDCGRYWRLARYKEVWPKPVELRPEWYELGLFGTWWYVHRRGKNNASDSSNPAARG